MADNPIVGFTKDELTEMVRQILAEIPTSLPANGGNANTVGGKSADDLAQIIDFGFNQTDTKIATGKSGKTTIYRCTNWTDYPSEFIDGQGTLIAINYTAEGTAGTDSLWCTQFIVNASGGNKIYVRYTDNTYISDWIRINDGGNADTVDDYHVSDGINKSTNIPPEYFTDVARINPETKKIESWHTDNIKVALANRATNADTVNGHTVNTDVPNIAFSQTLNSGHSATSALNDGIYYCTNWTDYPSNVLDAQGTIIVTNYSTSNTYPWSHRTFYSPHSPNIWHGFTANGVWYGWKELSMTPIKSVQVGGTTDEYGKFLLWAGEYNKIPVCVETSGYRAYTFILNNINGNGSTTKLYYISLEDPNTHSPVLNKAITTTVYYTEI